MLLTSSKRLIVTILFISFALASVAVNAQSGGSSGSISGTVLDPDGAVVPNATVEIHNPVSHYGRSTTTDKSGNFSLANVPFNPYHMTVAAAGFGNNSQDVEVRSVVPLSVNVKLQVSGSTTSVTVEAGAADLLENDPTFHSDIDKSYFDRLPLESTTSGAELAGYSLDPGNRCRFQRSFPRAWRSGARREFVFYRRTALLPTSQGAKVFSNQASCRFD